VVEILVHPLKSRDYKCRIVTCVVSSWGRVRDVNDNTQRVLGLARLDLASRYHITTDILEHIGDTVVLADFTKAKQTRWHLNWLLADSRFGVCGQINTKLLNTWSGRRRHT